METYRLKNIAIIILLLLNAFLLLLLGSQYLQTMQAETDTAGQLRALCQSSQLELAGQIDLSQQSLPPCFSPARARRSRPLPPSCWAARRFPPARAAVSTAIPRSAAPSTSGPAAALTAAGWTCRWRTLRVRGGVLPPFRL